MFFYPTFFCLMVHPMSDLLRRTVASLWRRAPKWARRFGALLTESRFTVTVGAVVVDSRKRVLLLHHRFRPGSGWGVPGGFMRPREQPEESLRRELLEEIGLEVEIAGVAFIRALQNYRQVEMIFRCAPKGIPIPRSVEITRAEWFDLNSLPDGLSADQRGLIRRALNSD
jgi:8-oxo-dGTP diphosphatase